MMPAEEISAQDWDDRFVVLDVRKPGCKVALWDVETDVVYCFVYWFQMTDVRLWACLPSREGEALALPAFVERYGEPRPLRVLFRPGDRVLERDRFQVDSMAEGEPYSYTPGETYRNDSPFVGRLGVVLKVNRWGSALVRFDASTVDWRPDHLLELVEDVSPHEVFAPSRSLFRHKETGEVFVWIVRGQREGYKWAFVQPYDGEKCLFVRTDELERYFGEDGKAESTGGA